MQLGMQAGPTHPVTRSTHPATRPIHQATPPIHPDWRLTTALVGSVIGRIRRINV